MERHRDAVTLQIRKLRKKLRQIEHLESIERDLTDEELTKCIKKEALREQLLQLLADYEVNISTNAATSFSDQEQVNHAINTDFETSESIYTDYSTSQPVRDSEQNVPNTPGKSTDVMDGTGDGGDEGSSTQVVIQSDQTTSGMQTPLDSGRTEVSSVQQKQPHNPRSGSPRRQHSEPEQSSSSVLPSKKSKTTAKAKSLSPPDIWHTSGFIVTALDSHNDLVTAVDCCGSVFVTASRDTTVKVWDMKTLTELRSLGSHTGSVTGVVIVPGSQLGHVGETLGVKTDTDSLILSGSMDCSLKLWSLNTGELLKSIYIYNPITKVTFYKEQMLAVTASDGGKLELWDLVTKENVCSESAHSDSITGLCVENGRIFTSCGVEGEIKVFEVRDKSLHCLFVSENVRSPTGSSICMRHVRALNARGDNLMYGDDGINLKILSWKTGVVRKLPNHKEEFGITDAICCHGDLMVTSAYDLDRGQGYVNVFDISGSQPRYLATVDTEETGRIFSIACSTGDDKYVTMVTGGLELQVWRQVPISRTNPDAIATRYVENLTQPAQDSDLESDAEFSESDSDEGLHAGLRRGSVGSTTQQGWLSWCSIL